MQHTIRRRFPFVAVGIILVAVSVLPTAIAMVRAFNESRDEIAQSGTGTTISGGIAIAFHPALILCGLVGLVLIAVGVVGAFTRSRRLAPGDQ